MIITKQKNVGKKLYENQSRFRHVIEHRHKIPAQLYL